MEHKSKRTETVRPQFGECFESQSQCDSVLSVNSGVNDIELNGETDDEDMEDGDMGFDGGSAQVRNIRDPGKPTVKEHQEHMTTHRPYRSWCKFCVMERGVNAPHRRSDAQDDLEGVPHVSVDCGFFWREGIRGSCESCAGHPGTETQDDVGEAGSPELQREQRGSSNNMCTKKSRSSATTSRRLRHWRGRSHRLAKREARPSWRDHQWGKANPMISSSAQWDSWLVSQNTEGCAGASQWDQNPARRKDTMLAGGICCIPDEQV